MSRMPRMLTGVIKLQVSSSTQYRNTGMLGSSWIEALALLGLMLWTMRPPRPAWVVVFAVCPSLPGSQVSTNMTALLECRGCCLHPLLLQFWHWFLFKLLCRQKAMIRRLLFNVILAMKLVCKRILLLMAHIFVRRVGQSRVLRCNWSHLWLVLRLRRSAL